jgi:hypothetical protein
MAKFTAKDMADFRQAYFSLMQLFAPLHEVYNSYERQPSPGRSHDDIEQIRLQAFRLETFIDRNPLVTLGRLRLQMKSYLEDDDAGYLPGMMSEEAGAVYGMMQHDDAAVMMKGCVLSNLILNVAFLAAKPQADSSVRLALAENLRLACYFSEVASGAEPAESIRRYYPEDRARIAELPFSNSIDAALRETLDRAVKQVHHMPKLEAPEGYEWKRSEKKPHLRVLLKLDS